MNASTRGSKKFGDKCESTTECGFAGSFCDPKKHTYDECAPCGVCRAPINKPIEPEKYIDPAMIGVLVAMAVMFIIICVVLRLFSK
uniref:Uncharacterized protein n=1 Tax=Anopheles dirus TaxID=7168 RepID=A0A182NN19_9DIPT